MDFIEHKFRPSETIDAVLRLKGRHDHTPQDLVILRKRFNELNGTRVPHPGEVFKIPLLQSPEEKGEPRDPKCDEPSIADDDHAKQAKDPHHE